MIITSKPERNETIDYFSYSFDDFDLHETWKNATKTKDLTENGRRFIVFDSGLRMLAGESSFNRSFI
jgi:hypothetical protein